jgi:hypothetical protein
VVASLALAAPASAAKGELVATCEGLGEVAVTTSSGAAFWIGDVLYLPLTFRVTAGGETVYEKRYGRRSGLRPAISCRTLPNEAGFAFEVTAVRVPPRR